MYGKHFESMYEGSMYGAGVSVFAVWGYVIAHIRESKVELNPKKLADTLGGKQEEIVAAIDFLMKPDPESRHKQHEGRRLLQEGQFQYFVPSWEDYQGIRNAAARREYNRIKQAEYRLKRGPAPHKIKTAPLPGESASLAAESRGDQAGADAIASASLPETEAEAVGRKIREQLGQS